MGRFFAHSRGFHALVARIRNRKARGKIGLPLKIRPKEWKKEEGLHREKTVRRTFLERGSPSHLQLSHVLRILPSSPSDVVYSLIRANAFSSRLLLFLILILILIVIVFSTSAD